MLYPEGTKLMSSSEQPVRVRTTYGDSTGQDYGVNVCTGVGSDQLCRNPLLGKVTAASATRRFSGTQQHTHNQSYMRVICSDLQCLVASTSITDVTFMSHSSSRVTIPCTVALSCSYNPSLKNAHAAPYPRNGIALLRQPHAQWRSRSTYPDNVQLATLYTACDVALSVAIVQYNLSRNVRRQREGRP